MRYLILFLLSLGIAVSSYAEDISISAEVDKQEITIDDQLTLTITITGNVSNIPQPKMPNLTGFTAYSSGRSQNISIINGQVNSSVTFTYILVPNDVGDYRLGPFTIDYKGKTYSAGPIDIKVLPRSSAASKSQGYPQVYKEEESSEGIKRGELFIETYVDKLTAYVNEQITLTFAFYQAVNLFENPVYSPPSTEGFWSEDMPPQRKYYKTINGRRYLVTEIKTALFATSPGEFTIGPARLEASVEDLEEFFTRNPFDIFDRDPFSIFHRGKPIVLTSEPIQVKILPLPEDGKPLDFKGDVGRFDVTATLDKNIVEENQPVTLKIVVKGEGNIKTVSSPIVKGLENAKVYDSGSSENISKSNYIVQGERIFEKVIIPKQPGKLSIGPIEYCYFDIQQKRYIKRTLGPFTIDVEKAKEEPAKQEEHLLPIEGLTKEEVRLLKEDIRYIKTGPTRLRPKGRYLYTNKIFWMWNILPLFALVIFYIYDRHRRRMLTDIGYARSRRARGLASRRLRQARDIMRQEKTKEFYAEVYKAVIEYIADKINIPHPSITKDLLEKELKKKAVPDSVIDKIKDLFDICDLARFASGRFSRDDMAKTFRLATDIISEVENFL